MRNISFALTETQFLARTKTVTRRLGWKNLKPGAMLCGVRKAMGLKSGENIIRLGVIRVISTRRERLSQITAADCVREGFPDLSPRQFVLMFKQHMNCRASRKVTRIEFKHVKETPCL